jgi:predicted transcriptional regulator
VSTNLRLSPELVAALREAADRTGRSQQDIIREAITKQLGLVTSQSEMQRAIDEGTVQAPSPFRDVEPSLELPPGTSSLDLLVREDR